MLARLWICLATRGRDAPSNLASIGRYVLTPDIFEILRGLNVGSGGEIQLADAIGIYAQQGFVETIQLNGQRLTSAETLEFAPHITLTNSDYRFIIGEQF